MDKPTHYVVIDWEGVVVCVREKREDATKWMAKRAMYLDEDGNTALHARALRLAPVYEPMTEPR
jgi:hypothetical protein